MGKMQLPPPNLTKYKKQKQTKTNTMTALNAMTTHNAHMAHNATDKCSAPNAKAHNATDNCTIHPVVSKTQGEEENIGPMDWPLNQGDCILVRHVAGVHTSVPVNAGIWQPANNFLLSITIQILYIFYIHE